MMDGLIPPGPAPTDGIHCRLLESVGYLASEQSVSGKKFFSPSRSVPRRRRKRKEERGREA